MIRTPVKSLAPLICLLAAVGEFGCGSGSGGAGQTPPIQLQPGMTLGQAVFPAGDTAQGGQGQTVDGIPAGPETVTFHVHAHVSLFVNGEQIAIPEGVGIVNNGSQLYEIHTHDASGIIHLEAPAPASFTLGQFFDIWGEPLSTSSIAGYTGPEQVYINGSPYTGDLRSITFAAHQEITLEVGTPVTPPSYIFPPGF